MSLSENAPPFASADASRILKTSAVEQARLIRNGDISSEELTRLYLGRIWQHDAALSSFVTVFDRSALREARQKDAERRRSASGLPPFHGVPIGIKDLNLVRFSTAHFGSRALKMWSPIDDASTGQLRRGGFVILGKLAASELGTLPVTEPDIHPPTRNPWSLGHTPGGSSGGSAAAVAGGLLPIAHGSDGAGSIRIPASFCHLYGIKPSRGRLQHQLWRYHPTILYTCGPLARSVDDAAAMLDVMAGVTVGKPFKLPLPERPFQSLAREAPKPLRIRMMLQGPIVETHPEIVDAVRRVARALEACGHHIEEVATPAGTVEEFLPMFQKMVCELPGVRWEDTQPTTRWLAEAGKSLTREFVLERHQEMARRIDVGFTGADAWLSPTVPVLPPAIGAWKSLGPAETFAAAAPLGAFTAVFNLLGYPAASVPAGVSSDGRPIGVQIACRSGLEARVLALSRQVEEALPWEGRTAFLG